MLGLVLCLLGLGLVVARALGLELVQLAGLARLDGLNRGDNIAAYKSLAGLDVNIKEGVIKITLINVVIIRLALCLHVIKSDGIGVVVVLNL